MHDRFTERVKKVLYLAREEAGRLRHDHIGSEHLLLGIIRDGEGIAANVLTGLGLDLEEVRVAVEAAVPPGPDLLNVGEIPFTPRARRVLELSMDEAQQLGHNYVGTEHLLLGLIREGDGRAARVLIELGADRKRVREETLKLLNMASAQAPRSRPEAKSETPAARVLGGTVILVAGRGMGRGEPELQLKLLRTYLTVLLENHALPGAICFYTDGVKLVVEGSPVLDLLQRLEELGVHLIVCQTCLEYFQLTEKVRVGIVGGMGDIQAAQLRADKVITL